MKTALISTCVLAVLASCGPNKHVNSWDRQSPALDPVGITSKKLEAKNKAELATYKPGESVTFRSAKLMVFELDPEQLSSASGTVKSGVDTAKVLVCGDMFAKVQFPDGQEGYVSLSEIINPAEMMNLYPMGGFDANGMPLPAGVDANGMPLPATGSNLPAGSMPLTPRPAGSSEPIPTAPLPESSVKQ